MSTINRHIIHSLSYLVQFENTGLTDQQDALAGLHYSSIEGICERIFNSYSSADSHLQINSLELDLGKIAVKNWESDLVVQFEKVLTKKLVEMAASGKNILYRDKVREDKKKETGERAIFYSEEETLEDTFLFFLKYGYLKWTISGNESYSVNTNFKNLLAKHSDKFNERLKAILLSSEIAFRRFILQTEFALRWEWLKGILPEAKEIHAELQDLQIMISPQFDTPDKLFKKMYLWLDENLIFHLLKAESSYFDQKGFFSLYFLQFEKKFENIFKNILEPGKDIVFPKQENQGENRLLQLLNFCIDKLTYRLLAKGKFRDQSIDINDKQNDLEIRLSAIKDKNKYKDDRAEEVVLSADKEVFGEEIAHILKEDLNKGLLVTNAGLVLLWPYFSALFSEFHLLENNKFKGQEEANQALYMLHYLATGSRQAEEHELFVPKILSAYDLETAVPEPIELNEDVYKECDQLLKIAIKNWAVLKSTSPAGLRQTFLQRSALTYFKDDAWHFMFEKKGVDVLIDYLSFPISVIKLKWMDYPIYVTW